MKHAFFLFLVLILIAPVAQAEVFVWQDENTKLTVAYPDRWGMTSNQKPDDVLTILAPENQGQGDQAACRLRVNQDGRFKIYPRRLADAVQRVNVSKEFWTDYMNEFSDPVLVNVTDNAGLGDGFAGMAQARFTPAGPAPVIRKQGLMLATIYNDKAYVFECSARSSAYPQWHGAFLSILKSVSFRPEYHADVNGHYRNFMGDDPVIIKGERPFDETRH